MKAGGGARTASGPATNGPATSGPATTGPYRRALVGWVDFVQRRAGIVVVAALALTGAAAVYTANNLAINTSTADIISAEVAFRRNDLAFGAAFPRLGGDLVVVVEGPSPEAAETAAERLEERLSRDGEHFHDVYRPGSEAYLRRNGLLFLDIDELDRLTDRLAAIEPLLASLAADPSLRGLADVLDLALAEADEERGQELADVLRNMAAVARATAAGQALDLSWQALLAGDAATGPARRFLLARPIQDHSGLNPAAAAIDALRAAARAVGIEAGNGLSARLTGNVALNQEELDSVEVGGKTAGILSLVLVTVLLVVGLRSGALVLATVATLMIGLVWTAGFATLAVGELNLISVAFAVLFVGLGVDFGIHMCLRYREELVGDATKADAIRRTGGGVGGALGLSALAAAVGFYSFLPTDYRGLAELGLIAGTGMFLALLANLTVLPALLALLPRPSANPWRPISGVALQRASRPILAVAAVLAVLAAVVAPAARFDFNPLSLKDPSTESVATFLDLAGDPDTTPYVIKVLADDAAAAGSIVDRLAAIPEAGRVITLASFVPVDQDEKLAMIDDLAFFLGSAVSAIDPLPPPTDDDRQDALARLRAGLILAIGAEGDLAAAAAELDAALATSVDAAAVAELERRWTTHLPRALDQLRTALEASDVSLDDIPAELRARWQADSGAVRIDVQPAIPIADNTDLRRFADAVVAVVPTASGGPVIITEAGRVVLRAFLQATALAVVLISLLILGILRRFSDVILVLVPLIFAALMTVAASVLLGLAFNFANVIVLPLLLGLGVSSSIHLVMRRREAGVGVAVLSSSTPRAVLFSSLTTVAAFGSLAVSGHPGMTSMGQLLTVAILFVLLATLVVLPCLMSVISRPPVAGP